MTLEFQCPSAKYYWCHSATLVHLCMISSGSHRAKAEESNGDPGAHKASAINIYSLALDGKRLPTSLPWRFSPLYIRTRPSCRFPAGNLPAWEPEGDALRMWMLLGHNPPVVLKWRAKKTPKPSSAVCPSLSEAGPAETRLSQTGTDQGPSGQSYGFSSSPVWMGESDHQEGWVPKYRCFKTGGLEKTLESPLDCKEIQPVHPKGDQSWVFVGRTDGEAETSILWPPDAKSWLIGKDPDAGKDWRQEEKGTIEDEMVGWHHRLNEHLSKLWEMMKNREAWRAAVRGVAESHIELGEWTTGTDTSPHFLTPSTQRREKGLWFADDSEAHGHRGTTGTVVCEQQCLFPA